MALLKRFVNSNNYFPTVPIVDTCVRTNEGPPPSSKWTTDPWGYGAVGHKVLSNVCVGSGVGDNHTKWNTSYGPNVEGYITIGTKPPDASEITINFREVYGGVGLNDGYNIQLVPAAGTDVININRNDDNTATLLGAAVSQEVSNGDSIGFSMVGTTITLYYKSGAGAWTALTTRTDSTYTLAGGISIYTDGATSTFTNFGAGTSGDNGKFFQSI